MKKRIAVLGNSHVASLKDGWEGSGKKTTIHADFFGALKDGMASFGPQGDKLGPRETGAAEFFRSISTTGDFLDPKAYDAFVLTGMKFFPNSVIRNYAAYATPSTGNQSKAGQFVSDAVIEQMLWDEVDRSMLMHVARVVQAHVDTKTPVFLAWQPFLSTKLMQIEWRAEQYQPLLDHDDGAYVRAIMDRVAARLKAEGFIVLDQPEETIENMVMTEERWSQGSRTFRTGGGDVHRDMDVFHMNKDFGQACWRSWLKSGPLAEAL